MALGGAGAEADTQTSPKSLELAYEAVKTTLVQQDATLTNVRNRATALFTSAAIAVSFTAGVGLISGDGKLERQYPAWAGIALITVLTLMSIAVLTIHWPAKRWTFGASSSVILDLHDKGQSEAEIRRHVIDSLIAGRQANGPKLELRQKALRAMIFLLWAEVVLILAAITTA